MARPFSPWWDSLPGSLAKKEGIVTNEIAILGIDLGKNSCSVVCWMRAVRWSNGAALSGSVSAFFGDGKETTKITVLALP